MNRTHQLYRERAARKAQVSRHLRALTRLLELNGVWTNLKLPCCNTCAVTEIENEYALEDGTPVMYQHSQDRAILHDPTRPLDSQHPMMLRYGYFSKAESPFHASFAEGFALGSLVFTLAEATGLNVRWIGRPNQCIEVW
jgi:hypothetical protein